MPVLIADSNPESPRLSQPASCSDEGFDEVWEGLTVMAPLPNDDHQEIQGRFVAAFQDALGWDSPAKIRAGVNVSDRNEDWISNYRCPDVVVFLPGNKAINHRTHWEGGPDFLIEILSERDRAPEKLPFYAKVGVREALIVYRDPWALRLYTTANSPGDMQLAATILPDDKTEIRSGVLPLVFQLQSAIIRPRIRVALAGGTSKTGGGRDFWII